MDEYGKLGHHGRVMKITSAMTMLKARRIVRPLAAALLALPFALAAQEAIDAPQRGQLRINGQLVNLPGPSMSADGDDDFRQARHVPGSCMLPAYPAQVVEQDAPLSVSLDFVVDPHGQPRELKLVQPSGYPEYDSALLATFATCRFTPAMRGGQYMAHTETYLLTRAPGSMRP